MTVTLITGANKGLGYETARLLTARGHTVCLGARSVERGQAAAARLGARFVRLDVTADASAEAAMRVIEERDGLLDILVNNASIWDGRIGVDGLTGNGAGQTAAAGAEVIADLATIGKDGPTGTFQEKAGELPWQRPGLAGNPCVSSRVGPEVLWLTSPGLW
jgi:NAD(P)-dependent dehydrogenase (short-subunit alcohol dehydrogenase family)